MSDRLQLSHTPYEIVFPRHFHFYHQVAASSQAADTATWIRTTSGDVRCQQDANFHYCSQSAFGQTDSWKDGDGEAQRSENWTLCCY